MKSVLISIQPYWVFFIIAEKMGWKIDKSKTIEVRKNYPKSENWDKVAKIYCSKDIKSFAKIPKEYQPLMKQFLGKVIGEFVCDKIYEIGYNYFYPVGYDVSMGEISRKELYEKSCLSFCQIDDYLNMELGYGWHISDLVIYDKPRELSEFRKECKLKCDMRDLNEPPCEKCENLVASFGCGRTITRPPQSWLYVESEVQGE